jgi:hypothetical protein
MAGYAKLFGSILFSTIWAESKDVKILWITMLALADADGTVEAAVPGLAMASRLTPDECRAALLVLESPDPDSKNPENEGRRVERVAGGWRILNYLHYRNKMTVAYRRELNAQRVRKHREGKATKPEEPPPAAPINPFDGSPNETTCPPLLADFERLVAPEMVKKLSGATRAQLTDSANRFIGYYTIGKGMNQRRRFWMRELRNWIVKDHGEGKLGKSAPRRARNDELARADRIARLEAEEKRERAAE